MNDPISFFKDLFTSGYQHSGGVFSGENSYWNDLKNMIVIKMLAICNLFTLKNYFADLVLFNFIFFFGSVAFYRTLQNIFSVKKFLVIICVFLIPSFLFWCSGVHKDGLIFTAIALIVFHFEKLLRTGRMKIRSVLILLLWFCVLFFIRNFMALLLLPALFAWFLAEQFPSKAKVLAVLLYGCGVVLFFISPEIPVLPDLPQYIIDKQNEFKNLSGNSAIAVPPLENNVASFIRFLPTAIDIAFFRPHITDAKNLSYFPAAIEVFIFWLVVLLAIWHRLRKPAKQTPFVIFCLCFSLSFLLVAGYTITFSGAIVRYKAVVLPFLCAALLPSINTYFSREKSPEIN
jgi:hypothetical protein